MEIDPLILPIKRKAVMANRYCSVPQCSNKDSTAAKGLSFHLFPKNTVRQKQWVTALKIGKKVSKCMMVCGEHFKPENFFYSHPRASAGPKRKRLKLTAVPSAKLPVGSHDRVARASATAKVKRAGRLQERRKRKPEAAALSCEFGPKRDFNSTTTDFNMPNPADSEAIEGTVHVKIEEHPIDVKPELDLMPTFDRHYVFLPEGPTMDVDLYSAATSVVHMEQESDPFTALPSVDTERADPAMMNQIWDSSNTVVKTELEETVDYESNIMTSTSIQPIEEYLMEQNSHSSAIAVKSEPEDTEDAVNISGEQNIPTYTSILKQYLMEQKPKISADTNICHIEGDAAFSRKDNDPEAGPSQNIDPLNQSLLHPRDFPFPCNECTYKGTSRRCLVLHNKLHSSEKKHQCSQCDYITLYKSELVRHLRRHSGQRPFACDICTYKCASSSNLAKHKLRHTNEKKFHCSHCDFRAHVKYDLVRHLGTHTGERPQACDICTYICSDSGNLAQHKLCHSNEKMFKCSQCDFRAHRKNDVVAHMRIHSGERPYACDLCEGKCKSSSALVSHKKIHFRSVKNFKCDKCNYECVRSGDLTAHIKTHSGVKSYKCDKCNYACVRRWDLTRHKKFHFELKPYQCDKCTYSCVQSRDLTKHKIRQHK